MTPVAQPVNTYFGVPNLPQPTLRTLTDLSPLSESISRLAQAAIPAAREEMAREASIFAAENKEALQGAKSREEIEALVAKNFKGTQSPLFWRTLYSQSGASMAAMYQAQLAAEAPKYTTISDANGLLQEPKESIDAIQTRVTADFLKHPLMQDFYARSTFAEAKAQVDADFAVKVQVKRDGELLEYQKQQTINGISVDLEGFLTAATPRDSKAHLDSLDMRITDLYNIYGADARGLFWNAASSSVRQVATTDPQKALEMIALVDSVKVGGTELGADTRYQASLAELRKDIIERRDADVGDAGRQMTAKRNEAEELLTKEFYPALAAAWEKGENLVTVAQNMRDTLPARFGEWSEYAGQKINEQVRALRSTNRSNATAVAEVSAMASSDAAGAKALLDAYISTGDIVGPDVLKLQTAVLKGQDLDPFLRDQNYNNVLRSFEDFKPKGGMSPEYAQTATAVYEGRVKDFERAYIEFAKANQQDPAKVQAWLAQQQDALQTEFHTNRVTYAKTRQETLDALNARISKGAPSRPLIDQAARAGLLTEDEQRAYRIQQDNARTFEKFLDSKDMKEIEQYLTEQSRLLGREGDRLALSRKARELLSGFKEQARPKLEAMAADDKMTPEDMERMWAEEVRKFGLEVNKQIDDFASASEQQEAAEASVEPRAELGRNLDAWVLKQKSKWFVDDVPAEFFNETVDKHGGSFRSLGAGFERLMGHPTFYGQYAEVVKAVQNRTADAPAQVARLRQSAGTILAKVLTDKTIPKLDRDAAVSNILALTGTTAEIALAGTVKTGVGTIKLDDDVVNPFTTPFFQSSVELMSFMQTSQGDALMKRYGFDPTDQQDISDFISAQRVAISRLNTDG